MVGMVADMDPGVDRKTAVVAGRTVGRVVEVLTDGHRHIVIAVLRMRLMEPHCSSSSLRPLCQQGPLS